MMSHRVFLILSIVVLSTGCRRDDAIQTYRVSKETESPMGQTGQGASASMQALPGMAPAASPREVSWTVPAGWIEQTPSTMRVGSFLVKGENGQQADVSVIPLSGDAGGDLANVNRWRGQINLDPISEAQLAQGTERITIAGKRMTLVDMASDSSQKRFVAAIYTEQDRTWFFKMIGDDATVRAAKPSFKKFLNSLRFAKTQDPSPS